MIHLLYQRRVSTRDISTSIVALDTCMLASVPSLSSESVAL